MRFSRFLPLVGLLTMFVGTTVSAQMIPGLSATNITPGTTYPAPVALRAPHDGSGRLFIVQQGGLIRIVRDGAVLPTPFLTVAVRNFGESGLLGMAFHPNFGKAGLPHNDEFYVSYTRPTADPRLGLEPDQVIARYTVPVLDSDVANPTGTLVIRVPDPATNHNGGDIHFGPDGYLYSSMGDGGPQNNQHRFAECLWKKPASTSACGDPTGTQYYLLGKILRLDVDNRGNPATADMCGSSGISPAQYSIPRDNPHVGTSNTCDEIWLHGLRNPWRFSFDRATDDLIIGDVGQGLYEEVTVQAAGTSGSDHGWSRCEGRHAFHATGTGINCPAVTGTVAPVIEYGHIGASTDTGTAVTGGYVYRGPSARLRGTYFYGDSGRNDLRYATVGLPGTDWSPGGVQNALTMASKPYGFGEDEVGNLYITLQNSTVLKISSDFIFDTGFD